MKVEEKTIVKQFVELVASRRHGDPDFIESELTIFLGIVRAAGFDAKAVIPGFVTSGYVEQDDPNRTWQKYNINDSSKIKVIGSDDKGDSFATGWLNDIFQIAQSANYNFGTTDKVIIRIQKEIENSIPFKPIQLTQEGDMLIEKRSEPDRHRFSENYLQVKHVRDADCFDRRMFHAFCRGEIDIRRTTADYKTIYCDDCNLRVSIPLGIQNFGELRDFMNSKFGIVGMKKREGTA